MLFLSTFIIVRAITVNSMFYRVEIKMMMMMMGVNGRTDRLILKIFLPGFWIQSEILTDFRILQFQRIADSSIPYARILDLACN